MMQTKSRIICLTKTEGLPIQFSVSYEKDTTKDTEGQTINKTVTNQNHTEPKQTKNCYLKPGNVWDPRQE